MVKPIYPTRHTVEHVRRAGATSTQNALGQSVPTPGAGETRAVYGWRPKATSEGRTAPVAGRVITELYLLTPDGDYAAEDWVRVPGRGLFAVVGDDEDFNAGPFGFQPGYRFTLRKVTDGPL